jgi:hypothetical protein
MRLVVVPICTWLLKSVSFLDVSMISSFRAYRASQLGAKLAITGQFSSWEHELHPGNIRVMVTGNAKCLPTIFEIGYLWLDNLPRFSSYSSLKLIHLRFTIHLIVPGTVKTLISNYTYLYLSLYCPQLLRSNASQQVSRNPVLGLAFRPPT